MSPPAKGRRTPRRHSIRGPRSRHESLRRLVSIVCLGLTRPRRPARLWHRSRRDTQSREHPALEYRPPRQHDDYAQPVHDVPPLRVARSCARHRAAAPAATIAAPAAFPQVRATSGAAFASERSKNTTASSSCSSTGKSLAIADRFGGRRPTRASCTRKNPLRAGISQRPLASAMPIANTPTPRTGGLALALPIGSVGVAARSRAMPRPRRIHPGGTTTTDFRSVPLEPRSARMTDEPSEQRTPDAQASSNTVVSMEESKNKS